MSSPDLSVVLCTHNPDPGRFGRSLEALEAQTLDPGRWELVVVDNASRPALAEDPRGGDLDHAQLVREEELGLTAARLTGIASARGGILVFVDDDNVLEPEYLERALLLMNQESKVGAAGGIVEGEFERPPPQWAEPFVNLLGVRDFGDRPVRALVYDRVGPWEPIGAGMVVRREVAERYRELATRPARRSLDRVGGSLASCGDTDMARCAPELGYYLAYEPSLRLRHMIPARRTSLVYLARLCRALKRSGMVLDRIRGTRDGIGRGEALARLPLVPLRSLCRSPRQWILRMATMVGELEGLSASIQDRGP